MERFAFLQGLPEAPIAHDYRVDHPEIVECELILTQDAELFGPGHRALGRLQFAGEDIHERRLARTVGAGDGVAPSLEEGRSDVFEQYSSAEAHSDVVNGQQRTSIVPESVIVGDRSRGGPKCDNTRIGEWVSRDALLREELHQLIVGVAGKAGVAVLSVNSESPVNKMFL